LLEPKDEFQTGFPTPHVSTDEAPIFYAISPRLAAHDDFCAAYPATSEGWPACVVVICGLLGVVGSGARAQVRGQQGPAPPPEFISTCALCHGNDGKGTDRAPTMVNSANLQSMSDSDIAAVIQKARTKCRDFRCRPPISTDWSAIFDR